VRLDYHFDGQTFGRLLATVSKEDTAMDHLDSVTRSGGVGLYREVPFGISLYLQALFSDVAFKGDYPSVAFARHDQRWDFSVNVIKRDLNIFGFAPQVQYTCTTNNSNIAIHEYDAHGINITLTKRF
jgi:hypothetical protein